MNRINSSYIFDLTCHYICSPVSGRHKYVLAHCMHKLGDLKKMFKKKKNKKRLKKTYTFLSEYYFNMSIAYGLLGLANGNVT